MAIGDTFLPEIRFAADLPYTIESDGHITFNLELSEVSSSEVTVFFRSLDGSADGGGFDYNSELEEVSFAAGDDTASFTVYVQHDTLGEPDEFYFVELFNPVGATFGGRNHSLRATGWIQDNDAGGGQPQIAVTAPIVLEGAGVAVFTVSLSEEAASDTEVSFSTVSDSAIAGRDFVALADSVTIAEGETSATVEIALRNDRQREAAESFGLRVEAPGGRTGFARATLLDDDGPLPTISIEGVERVESDGYVDFTLRLSEAAAAPVTVAYRTVDGSGDGGGEDYNTTVDDVTFEIGDHTARVRVYVQQRHPVGSGRVSYFVELFNPVGATFGGRNHSLRAAGWIYDDDAGGGQRAVDVVAPVVVEGNGEAVFTVSLSEAFATDDDARLRHGGGLGCRRSDFVAAQGRAHLPRRPDRGDGRDRAEERRQGGGGRKFRAQGHRPRRTGRLRRRRRSSTTTASPHISIDRAHRVELDGYHRPHR